ncbi:ATP-binding cassette domain-containing protein [Caproicibacter fermentans]|uniref:ATP-binding cassette domain-containing protein n=1 Tax=Caproicibacter fermentans TaxID=2576756 RepID=A0A7G8TAX3_9FIRM|nr:ATP-binding cassette domain-containing protein [Caproicibacter fermentans]QNK40764.1 ATP-binding cassette domain-containing protein [Caproicibacter fermentans]
MKLTLSHVTKEFEKKYAVEDFSAQLERGVYGLLGPNGAGKTTLMRMMADILTPSSGRIQLDGVDISELGAAYRDKLGYMPQEIGVYRNFSARRFLKYLSALKGIPSGEADETIVSLLELVGLKDVADKKLGGFSGGMIRRIGIAQALLNDPKILILDEPTAGLDPQERIRFRNIISESNIFYVICKVLRGCISHVITTKDQLWHTGTPHFIIKYKKELTIVLPVP